MKKCQASNLQKLGAFILALMIAAYIAPLCIAYAASEKTTGIGEPSGPGDYPEVPGVPDNTVQYNKTDVTPVAETEQVQAGEPALFQYRNMTMLMNCTQNCSIVFTSDPEVTPKILGVSVEPNQTMTLTMNMYGSPQQGEQVAERTLNFYLGIEPNAELQLTAQLRLHINQTELSQELNRAVYASQLTWMYWNRTQAQWVPVESYMDQNGYLVCNTNHFSLWTVAELAADSSTNAAQGGIPAEYVYVGAAVTVVAVAAVAVVAYKKRK